MNAQFGPESGHSGTAVATGSKATGLIRAGSATHPLAWIVDVASAVQVYEASTNTWAWKPNMTADGIHPNVAGHTVIAALASSLMFPA